MGKWHLHHTASGHTLVVTGSGLDNAVDITKLYGGLSEGGLAARRLATELLVERHNQDVEAMRAHEVVAGMVVAAISSVPPVLFEIDLQLVKTESIAGLAALDVRRRLGLPERVTFYAREPRLQAWVPVSEGFARVHFDPQATRMTGEVLLDWLVAGELMEDSNERIVWNPDISPERVRVLFAAGGRLRESS